MIELLSDDPLTNFKNALMSKSTQQQYPKRLKYFFDSLYTKENEDFVPLKMDIQDQIKEFMSHKDDPKYIEECFKKMIFVQKKRVAKGEIEDSTIFNYYKAAKVFCDQNSINTNWKRVTKIIPKGKRHATDRIPTEQEIKTLVSYPDRRMKPIVYTMLSCGMRIEAWDYLRWKHITPCYDENEKLLAAKILIYAGDKEQYYSFITPEAYNYLNDYIRYRQDHGENITGDSWVIRDTFNSTIKNGNNLGQINKPNRLAAAGVKSLLERAATSQNLFRKLEKGEKHREWKLAHGLRKYFKTVTEQKLKSIHVELLIGHYIGVSTSYYKPNEKDVLLDYVNAVDVLTFDESNKNEIERKLTNNFNLKLVEFETKLKNDYMKRDFDHEMIRYEQKLKDKIDRLDELGIEKLKENKLIRMTDSKILYELNVANQINIFKESLFFKKMSEEDQTYILEFIEKQETRFIDLTKTIQNRLDELEHIEMEDDLIKI